MRLKNNFDTKPFQFLPILFAQKFGADQLKISFS